LRVVVKFSVFSVLVSGCQLQSLSLAFGGSPKFLLEPSDRPSFSVVVPVSQWLSAVVSICRWLCLLPVVVSGCLLLSAVVSASQLVSGGQCFFLLLSVVVAVYDVLSWVAWVDGGCP